MHLIVKEIGAAVASQKAHKEMAEVWLPGWVARSDTNGRTCMREMRDVAELLWDVKVDRLGVRGEGWGVSLYLEMRHHLHACYRCLLEASDNASTRMSRRYKKNNEPLQQNKWIYPRG
jgi:hypothetical protein